MDKKLSRVLMTTRKALLNRRLRDNLLSRGRRLWSFLMNPMIELAPLLKQLRLSGILDSLEHRNRQAIDKHLAYTEFLALLIQDEVARREQKKLHLRLRRANFRSQKTLEQFDFDFNRSINTTVVDQIISMTYGLAVACFKSFKSKG